MAVLNYNSQASGTHLKWQHLASEAGGSWVCNYPGLHCETLPQNENSHLMLISPNHQWKTGWQSALRNMVQSRAGTRPSLQRWWCRWVERKRWEKNMKHSSTESTLSTLTSDEVWQRERETITVKCQSSQKVKHSQCRDTKQHGHKHLKHRHENKTV